MTPEARARLEIDRLLTAAGWHVCDVKDTNLHAARGVAIREFPLNPGHGEADYLLYVDGKAAGVIGWLAPPCPAVAFQTVWDRCMRNARARMNSGLMGIG
jgi:hypothetical protein